MKKFISGVVVGALLMASASVFADDGLEQISAYLRPKLPIKLDGQPVELKNAPIIYEGSTYLPLRELAGLVGKEVYWNEAEQSVELGKRASTGTPGPSPTPTPTPTPTPGVTSPAFESLPNYLPNSSASALKADGIIYLPLAAGAEKYQLTIEWDEKTKVAKFSDIGTVAFVNEYAGGVEAFRYQGTVYLKESLLADMSTIAKQAFQTEYPRFRAMFRIGELTLTTTNVVQTKAEVAEPPPLNDFKIQWLILRNKETYMKQIAKDVQQSNASRTLNITFYYQGITLGWVTAEPNGTINVSLVANPFGN
ncbi:stalk domain-containing protein [Paenibacillus sp. HJGM_3]|uniref:stalk domain-containing protein n=1 Tax=Paenibacillus sp. HJGM_3 TaxID=3379816 RepID=UPI00385D783B